MARKYENFELKEFLRSATAEAKGIDNTPTFEIVDHLNELVGTVLQPLRSAWGKPIRVSSGFRCEALNKAVGGAARSAHRRGYAADIEPTDPKEFEKFRDFIKEWLQKTGVRFDQCIIESRGSDNRWMHIGLYNEAGQQRGQVFKIDL